MAKLLAHARFIIGALALVFVVAVATPAPAQQATTVNPTASSVKEDQLLQQMQHYQRPRHHSRRQVRTISNNRPAGSGANSTK